MELPMNSGLPQDVGYETIVRDSKTLKLKLQEARESEACLVIALGKPLGKRFTLNSEKMVIGRGSGAEIPILDRSLSREHAQVLKSVSGRFYIKDLGSTNGTYLNERKLTPHRAAVVKDGDFLKVGNVIFKFVAKGKIDNVFHKDILNLATRDDLTGTLNRLSLTSALEEGFYKARMGKKNLSTIICDLDNFKSINDKFGHSAGDLVLKETAKAIQGVIRSEDSIGRFGGDEFMVVLWDTSFPNACVVAERMRSKIEKLNFAYEGKKIHITVSLGVSSLDDSMQSINTLFKRADEAQYNAKKNGGNQVAAS
jgi:diguanylate cyclase (GGDEF)-like protein